MQVGLRQIQNERMLHPNEHIHCLVDMNGRKSGPTRNQQSDHDAATLGFNFKDFFNFEGPGLARLLLRSALMDAITASAPGPRPFLPTNFTPIVSQR